MVAEVNGFELNFGDKLQEHSVIKVMQGEERPCQHTVLKQNGALTSSHSIKKEQRAKSRSNGSKILG